MKRHERMDVPRPPACFYDVFCNWCCCRETRNYTARSSIAIENPSINADDNHGLSSTRLFIAAGHDKKPEPVRQPASRFIEPPTVTLDECLQQLIKFVGVFIELSI